MSEIQFDEKLLNEIVKNVPFSEKQTKGFFEIADIGSREVSFSKCYSYYLNPNEEHGLGRLFIDTLLSLLGNPFSLDYFVVENNQGTKNKKFIDILIRGVGRDLGNFLIIENKIFHEINNPFGEYWDHCTSANENKRLVLLTLKNENYNIARKMEEFEEILWSNQLHIDWVNKIQEKKIRIKLKCTTDEQEFVYQNFIKAISILNMYKNMTAQAKFYFNNTEGINMAVLCKEQTSGYVKNQIESASGSLGFLIGRTDSNRLRDFYLEAEKELVFYSIIFDKLFDKSHEIRITYSLHPKVFNKHGQVEELDKLFKIEAQDKGFVLDDKKNLGKGWHNYLTKIYTLKEEQFSKLEEFIINRINEFEEITKKITKHLMEANSK